MFFRVFPDIDVNKDKCMTIYYIELSLISYSHCIYVNKILPLYLFIPEYKSLNKMISNKKIFDYDYSVYYLKRIWNNLYLNLKKTSIELEPSIGKINFEIYEKYILKNNKYLDTFQKSCHFLFKKKEYQKTIMQTYKNIRNYLRKTGSQKKTHKIRLYKMNHLKKR